MARPSETTPAGRLHARADVYAADALTIDAAGYHDEARTYGIIRDELRRVAREVEDEDEAATD